MERGMQGRYESLSTGGERVSAFVPDPLPPNPPVEWSQPLRELFDQAHLALGRLDGISGVLPETSLFIYMYVRKEAVLSSQIEGTQSSLSDLLLFELEEEPGVPLDDVQEVSNYVAALSHGLKRIAEGFPLSQRLLREIHSILLSRGRGSNQDPGEFRRSQNWIGGTRPGNAAFVPPPAHLVAQCMDRLERFLHNQPAATPVLLKTALAHVQFETIHPFLDGNGRLGRLLITLLLCSEKVLREPLLYLSLYLKTHRSRYYELLGEVRARGDWEAWIEFFGEAVAEVSQQAVQTAKELSALSNTDSRRISESGRTAGTDLRVHSALLAHPVTTAGRLCTQTGLSAATVNSSLRRLEGMGIVAELTQRQRNRVFSYSSYVAIMSRGTEPIP